MFKGFVWNNLISLSYIHLLTNTHTHKQTCEKVSALNNMTEECEEDIHCRNKAMIYDTEKPACMLT